MRAVSRAPLNKALGVGRMLSPHARVFRALPFALLWVCGLAMLALNNWAVGPTDMFEDAPSREVVLHRAFLTGEIVALYAILRPNSFRWSWDRVLLALTIFAPWSMYNAPFMGHWGMNSGLDLAHWAWLIAISGFLLALLIFSSRGAWAAPPSNIDPLLEEVIRLAPYRLLGFLVLGIGGAYQILAHWSWETPLHLLRSPWFETICFLAGSVLAVVLARAWISRLLRWWWIPVVLSAPWLIYWPLREPFRVGAISPFVLFLLVTGVPGSLFFGFLLVPRWGIRRRHVSHDT